VQRCKFALTSITSHPSGWFSFNHMQEILNLNQLKDIPEEERKFWYIPESISTHMPIEECGENFVSLRSIGEEMGVEFILAPVAPGQDGEMYMREEAAKKLVSAARLLRKKTSDTIVLKITDAFRPLALQRKYFEEIKADIARKENLEGKALWERVTQFIADPELYPPHSSGGAVDLTLAYRDTGMGLEMGTSVDAIDDRANTWNSDVQGQALKNRVLLFDVMTESGFVNLATEWWHYSYGDGYWAAFFGKPYAIYAPQELVSGN